MSRSYENINYGLRPAKAIERKMFCELIQHLSVFQSIKDYKYVGLGSTYFTDFSLIHKTLGIEKLISIERDADNKTRFLFNKPYSCVEVMFSSTNDVLPTLEWNEPVIVWLDYDGNLDSSIIKDVETCIANLKSGSLLLVSVRAQHFQPHEKLSTNEELWEYRLSQLQSNIGRSRVPVNVTGRDLNLAKTSGVYRDVITNEINSVLKERNGTTDNNDLDFLNYKQLINLTYQDGAKMLTIGGLIYSNGHNHKVLQSKIDELSFVRLDSDSLNIETPNLTYREIHKLDSLLPNNLDLKTGDVKISEGDIQNLSEIIPIEDIGKYAKVYRYFPTFAESNL